MTTRYITRSKEIMGGAPVITGTRIPAERLRSLVRHGYDDKHIAKEFPGVSIQKIRGAIDDLMGLGLDNLTHEPT